VRTHVPGFDDVVVHETLFQGCNTLERLAATGSLPVRQQFCLVLPAPFKQGRLVHDSIRAQARDSCGHAHSQNLPPLRLSLDDGIVVVKEET
jgi:hypothetical protein